MEDEEGNRFSARAARYARVGANVGGVAARIAGARLLGGNGAWGNQAAALAGALGGLKGPMMKVAQMMASVPDLLPPEYAEELQKLQSQAPPMGAAFVKRRMQAELGAGLAFAVCHLRHLTRPPPLRSVRFTGRPPRTAPRSPASCNIRT